MVPLNRIFHVSQWIALCFFQLAVIAHHLPRAQRHAENQNAGQPELNAETYGIILGSLLYRAFPLLTSSSVRESHLASTSIVAFWFRRIDVDINHYITMINM
jgi:hypothetical protein